MPHSTRARDELSSTPPQAFVRARNALAARLRQRGRAREAAEIARLRRPSVALWLVNRLATIDPSGVRRLIDAADRLRRAQLREPRTMPDAVAQYRGALEHLMQWADRILADADVRSSPAVLRRAYATLSGAAADPSRHPDLRQGRLVGELEPGGFEVLGAMPTRHLTLVKPDGQREDTRAARERQRLDIAGRGQRETTRRETLAQRRQAVKLEAAAARRERAIERASRRAARLREELREVEARIDRERRVGPT